MYILLAKCIFYNIYYTLPFYSAIYNFSSYWQLREANFVRRNINLRLINQGYILNLQGRAKRVPYMLVSKIRRFTYEKISFII